MQGIAPTLIGIDTGKSKRKIKNKNNQRKDDDVRVQETRDALRTVSVFNRRNKNKIAGAHLKYSYSTLPSESINIDVHVNFALR